MKMTETEVLDIGNTLAREDITNLKTIQSLLNKELNYRFQNMKMTAIPPCYDVTTGSYGVTMGDIVSAPQKEEKKMNNICASANMVSIPAETLEERRIAHLIGRLAQAEIKKDDELKRHYGLIEDKRPSTAVELIERIKDGQYVLPEERKDQRTYYLLDQIEWRNPKVKKDVAAYNKARKEMEEHLIDVRSTVILEDQSEGLKAVKAFEKKSFH